jgi:hypothetical protein
MLAAPQWVNDSTAFLALFIALCGAIGLCWRIARPAFIESVRQVVREEMAPVVADQARITARLTEHLRHEEAEIGEMRAELADIRAHVGH